MNALPTGYILWKRKCAGDAIFGICFKEEETTEHMLLRCEWTGGIWLAGCFGLWIDKDDDRAFDQWLLQVFSGLDIAQEDSYLIKRYIAFTCWMIWKTRSKVPVGGKELNVQYTVQRLSIAGQKYDGVIKLFLVSNL